MEASIKVLADITKRDLDRLSIPPLVNPSDKGVPISFIDGGYRMRKARITGKHDGAIGQSGNNVFSPKETKVSSLIAIVKK